MKKQPIQLLSYLMILFSLLTTSVYASADNVTSITGPATIQHGESVTLNVDYVASEARHLVAYLKATTGEKKLYFYERVPVQAGSATKQFTFTVPANAPTNETYKYGTYIAPVGKYFKDNLGKAYQQDVQVESDGGAEDDVNSISGPATIKHGESVTLNVDYLASQKRDLVVYLKSTTDTKRKSEVYIRREVDAGSETEQFTFTVPDDAPTDETYKYGVYIAPVGGKFKDNLGKAYQQNVDVESADSVENPALTREQLQALVAEWKANPTQENADKISNANVSEIIDMSGMFSDSTFNHSLASWDVSNVTDMGSMFLLNPEFNQPIDNWDVSSVTGMRAMFRHATSFNQPLNSWDVSNLTDLAFAFSKTSVFNQPLANWDVSNITDMEAMFEGASVFNQPIGDWDISSVTTSINFATDSALQDSYNPF